MRMMLSFGVIRSSYGGASRAFAVRSASTPAVTPHFYSVTMKLIGL
jgi:hypothetical protein